MTAMRVVHLCNVPLPPEHPDHESISFHPGRWVLNLAIAQRKHAGINARLVMQVPGARHDFLTEMEGVPVHFVAAFSLVFFASVIMPFFYIVFSPDADIVYYGWRVIYTTLCIFVACG